MGRAAILLRPGKEHTGGSSDLLGEVKTGEPSRAEGTDGAGRSMDRAAEEGAGGDCSGKEFATVRERRGDEIMNRKVCRNLLLAGMLAGAAGSLRAQDASPPAPPPEAGIPGGPGEGWMAGPIGERIELLGFEGMHGGKVVTGAPFSAVAVSETTQTLADGNRISRKTQTNLFRDSHGRFRKEVTLPAIGPLATSGGPRSFVMINDPVAQQNFILHPEEKTAEKMGQPFGRMKGGTPGERHGAWKGNAESWEAKAAASGNFKKEDLGTQTIAGVSAQGTRYT